MMEIIALHRSDGIILADEILRSRVAEGAKYLDSGYPGWGGEIDLETFNVSSTSCCVMAQLNGGNYWRIFKNTTIMVDRGFDLHTTECHHENWQKLQRFWEEEILERKGVPA